MNLPQLTTVGGAYQYMIGLLILIAVVCALFFGGIYFGFIGF